MVKVLLSSLVLWSVVWGENKNGNGGEDCDAPLSSKVTHLRMSQTLKEIATKLKDTSRFEPISSRKQEAQLSREGMWSVLQAEKTNHWRGIPFRKAAQEMVMYPQLIWELQPRTIVEIGTYAGGSAVWLADTAKTVLQRDVPVLTVDIDHANLHPLALNNKNVHAHLCDVTDYASCPDFEKALEANNMERPWLVSEDAHFGLAQQLEWWHTKLLPGDYILVEDTSPDQNAWVVHINSKATEPVDKKLSIVRQFLEKYPDHYAIDTYYQDMFGYNSMKEWNSILKRVA